MKMNGVHTELWFREIDNKFLLFFNRNLRSTIKEEWKMIKE